VAIEKKVTFTGINKLALECGMSQSLVSYHISRGKSADEVRAFAREKGFVAKGGEAGSSSTAIAKPATDRPPFDLPRDVKKSHRVTTTTEATRHHTSFNNLRRGDIPSVAEVERENADDTARGLRLETFTEAQARKERALANKNELYVAERMGLLVPVQPFRAWLTGIAVKSRDILMSIGADLQDQLAIETNPVEIKRMIDDKMGRALSELAKFGDLGAFRAALKVGEVSGEVSGLADEVETETEPADREDEPEERKQGKREKEREKVMVMKDFLIIVGGCVMVARLCVYVIDWCVAKFDARHLDRVERLRKVIQ
jgi:hypothetical protein